MKTKLSNLIVNFKAKDLGGYDTADAQTWFQTISFEDEGKGNSHVFAWMLPHLTRKEYIKVCESIQKCYDGEERDWLPPSPEFPDYKRGNKNLILGEYTLEYNPEYAERRRLYFTDVFVYPQERQKGLGTDLLQSAVWFAKKRNIEELWAHVYIGDENDFKRQLLYHRQGFKFNPNPDSRYKNSIITTSTSNPLLVTQDKFKVDKDATKLVNDLIR